MLSLENEIYIAYWMQGKSYESTYSSICIINLKFWILPIKQTQQNMLLWVFPWFSQLGGIQCPRWIPSHDNWSCQCAHSSTRCFDVLKHTNQEPKKGKSKGQSKGFQKDLRLVTRWLGKSGLVVSLFVYIYLNTKKTLSRMLLQIEKCVQLFL
jgi:hypothetical protein